MNPDDHTPLSRLPLLALDLETTGLTPGSDRIVAVGVVPVDGGRVDLTRARRWLVANDDPGGAVTIHGLTHDDLADGAHLPEVLSEVRTALSGRVLLAHHAAFELGFLRAAHASTGRPWSDPPTVCTLRLQRRVLAAAGVHEPPRGALRLWQSRARFGLPAVRAHDSLEDALACAELYLAQVAELGARRHRPGHGAGARELTLREVRLRTTWWGRLRGTWRRWRRRRWGRKPRLSGGSR